jgi:hypothetical protein
MATSAEMMEGTPADFITLDLFDEDGEAVDAD